MIERFFFDRVYTEAAGAAIGSQDNRIVVSGTDEAKAALAFAQLAIPGTDIALQPAIIDPVPVAS
jgi:hypothetical protein